MNGSSPVFVDTNVLVYAYDVDEGVKHKIARDLLEQLWRTRRGVLSTQVLQEFYVTVTRKIVHPLERGQARRIIATYDAWPVQIIDIAGILTALQIEEQYQMSFWDALIIATAVRARAGQLLSEDLQSGQLIEGISVENPFR